MNILATLDVAAGLFFIYLVLSLFASETQERLASILQLRARNLRQTLISILERESYQDHRSLPDVIKDIISDTRRDLGQLSAFLFDQSSGEKQYPNLYRFYHRTTINAMNPSVNWHPGRSVGPSYIEANTFAAAMMQFLRQLPSEKGQNDLESEQIAVVFPDSIIADYQSIQALIENPNLPRSLQSNLLQLLVQAENRYSEQPVNQTSSTDNRNGSQRSQRLLISYFNDELRAWFEQIMRRSSGVYARTVKILIFLVSAVLVMILNVNTIHIVHELYASEPLRSQFAEMANTIATDQALMAACDESLAACQSTLQANTMLAELSDQIADARTMSTETILPIGWDFADGDSWPVIGEKIKDHFSNPEERLETIVGWLISAIAISMGAPYWFDLLSKLTNIRNTGKKPG